MSKASKKTRDDMWREERTVRRNSMKRDDYLDQATARWRRHRLMAALNLLLLLSFIYFGWRTWNAVASAPYVMTAIEAVLCLFGLYVTGVRVAYHATTSAIFGCWRTELSGLEQGAWLTPEAHSDLDAELARGKGTWL